MKVEEKKYVSIHYTLTLEDGEKVDSTEGAEPLGFIQGVGQIIEGLDKAILGKAVGETFTATISPEEGYGPHSEEMYRDIPLSNFPEGTELKPGQGFTASGPYGPVSFTVVKVEGDNVVADFNHALAGKTLNFEVTVEEVRDPTAEELAAISGDSGGCSPSACGSCGGGCG